METRRTASVLLVMAVLANWMVGSHVQVVGAWVRFVALLAAFSFVYLLRNWRRLYCVVKTLPRDVRFLFAIIRVMQSIKRFERMNASVAAMVERNARDYPDKKCFLFGDEKWTYRDVDQYCNKVARAFQRVGVQRGDVVALILQNRIENICIWVGLSKLGVVTALINRNLRADPLAHTINTAGAKVVVFGQEYTESVAEVRHELVTVQHYYRFGNVEESAEEAWFSPLLPLLNAEDTTKPKVDWQPGFHDPLLYIYTSGTTGLPKAAIITNAKVLFWPIGLKIIAGMSEDKDVLYCPLPLYHAAAGAYAVSLALVHRVPVALTAKFSASGFWSDCVKHGATCAQYIGELGRFLVLSPESPNDRAHRVRCLLGNGMSPAVWRRIQQRFGVEQVYEVYGATEGNIMMVNPDNKVGACGFMPRLLPRTFWPLDIVRVDAESMEPIRDDITGLCVRCEEGETGMLVGKINDSSVQNQFIGYLNREASKKKVLRDVNSQGDRYFVSGDLAVMDELGYIYFKDRTGDTFRWKGENVSTAEVEAVLTRVLLPSGVRELAVYGVQVPGHEGRAGMAALADPDGRADLGGLADALAKRLPTYARPVFIRIMHSLCMTGTHKVSKVPLIQEGYDVQDPVFVFDHRTGRYEPLDEARMEDIRENRLRI